MNAAGILALGAGAGDEMLGRCDLEGVKPFPEAGAKLAAPGFGLKDKALTFSFGPVCWEVVVGVCTGASVTGEWAFLD